MKPLDPTIHSYHWFTFAGEPADDLNDRTIMLMWNANDQQWHNTLNCGVATALKSAYIGPVARPYTNKELQLYKIKRVWDNTPGLTERATLIRLVRNSGGWCHSLHQTVILVKEALTYWAERQDMKAYELLEQFKS